MNANDLKDLRITEQHMAAFWERMEQIYGSKFTSEFGSAIDFWFRAFTERDLRAADLKRGLEKCLDAGEQFPPSLPKFLSYCRPKRHAAHVPFEKEKPMSLEDKRKAKLVANEQLAQLHKLVSKARESIKTE